MTQTLFQRAATALQAVIGTVPGLTVTPYEPRELVSLPAATIQGPTEVQRRPPDTGEPEIGAGSVGNVRFFYTTWQVRLYVKLDDPETAAGDVRDVLAQVIDAIDANPGLTNTADPTFAAFDTTVTRSTLLDNMAHNGPTPMTLYECEVEAWLRA